MMDPNDILLLAANTGRVMDMEFALTRGADVDAVDEDGYAAIHLAALSDNPKTITLLTKSKVRLDALNEEGLTAFQVAMDEKKYLSAETLSTDGCDTTMVWPGNNTALHKAVLVDKVVLVLALLSDKPDVNHRNDEGRSALMLAALSGHAQCVRLLLEHGALVSDLNKLTTTSEIQRLVMAWKAGIALSEHC